MAGLTAILLLVALATLVATGARHWSIPAPSLLVVVGVAVGLVPWMPAVHVAPQVIGVLVLPPLLYASAESVAWRDLRTVWRPVTVLAFGLVLASAAAVGFVAAALTVLPLTMAFVLGAVLSSTDPVAVTALGRRLSLPPRLQVLVQAESLFNDATSLVLFKVAVGTAVAAGSFSLVGAAGQFLFLGGGGASIGALAAGLVTLIRRRTQDPVLETVIALVTPYAAYVVADDLRTSGVTAVIVAGVITGNTGHKLTNAAIRVQVDAVYATLVFLLESVVFALIGLQLPTLVRDLAPGERGWPLSVLAVAATVVAVRLVWIFPLSAVVQHRAGAERVSWRVPAVTAWAGTRGVMPLAAALSIPLSTSGGAPLPHRSLVLTVTTAVVALTLVVQGFTLSPVVRRSGIALEPEHTAREEALADSSLARAGLRYLEELADLEAASGPDLVHLRLRLQARVTHDENGLPQTGPPSGATLYRELRRTLIAVETRELQHLYDTHRISDTTRRRIQRTLDLEDTGLAE